MAYKFSENIQRGILYLTKLNKNYFLEICNLIKPQYFEFPIHGRIYEVINSFYSKWTDLPKDEIIIEEVRKLVDDDSIIVDYQDELEIINSISLSSIDTAYYLDLIEEFAKKEAIKEAIQKSIPLIKQNKTGEILKLIQDATLVSRTVDLGINYFDSLNERWERELSEAGKERFVTPFKSLNFVLNGGNSNKELCMVVANSGVGKSIYLVNQGVTNLIQNKKVLFITLEMSADKVAKRFDSILTFLPNRQLNDPKIQLKLQERLEKVRKLVPDARLKIKEFPTASANVNHIKALLSQLKNYESFIPDVIIVDYLELLRPIREVDQEFLAQQRIAEELRGLSMEYNCLVWTATQTNRQGEKVKIITKAELGGSYDKIKPADFAISLNQTTEEYETGMMRIFILKSRDSRQRLLFPARVDYNTLRLEEVESEANHEQSS